MLEYREEEEEGARGLISAAYVQSAITRSLGRSWTRSPIIDPTSA